MRKRLTEKQMQKICDKFNEAHPVGSEVMLMIDGDDGRLTKVRTKSKACILCGHTPVVWLEGISGCYALTHVFSINETPNPKQHGG